MNQEAWMQVNLGASKVRVPVIVNAATTQKIAERISESLRKVETEADRIDTLYFFQLTAFYMAAELHQAESHHAEDSREILRALEKMQDKLRALLDTYHPEDDPAIIQFPDPSS